MEGVCNTSLCLGFGSQIQYKNADMKKFCGCVGKDHQDSHSDTQLFCKMGVKKEQDLGSEEIEVKSVHGHDRQEVGARKKLRLSKEQAVILEESFKKHSILNQKHKQALVKQLNVSPRQLEVWFQNRRARTKLRQMEVDAEYLNKFCETLKNENKILQKALDDLKASNVAPELRMQHTAATISLTMCPSCEYGSH